MRLKNLLCICIPLALFYCLVYSSSSAALETVAGTLNLPGLALDYPAADKSADEDSVSASLGVFGDISFTTNSREKTRPSFYLGEFDIYSSINHGDRLSLFAEVTLDTRESDEIQVHLRRLWIGYAFSDLLTVRAGRLHAAIGYWNKYFRHGRHLIVSVDRPFFLKSEHAGGILPLHITGLEMEGRRRFGFGALKYEFALGNGPKIDRQDRQLKTNVFSDDNGSKHALLRISANPTALPGLDIGVFWTGFEVNTAPDTYERIYGLDIAYRYDRLEVLSEYFRLSNSRADSDAYYIQVSFSGIKERFTPYARFERLEAGGNDPYLADLSGGFNRYQVVAGVRCDLDILASALKAQYRYDDTGGGNDFNVFELQWSFGF